MIKKVISFLHHFISLWRRYRISEKSAALSYYALFSLGPFAILIVSLSTIVLNPELLKWYIFNIFSSFLGQNGAQTIASILQNAKPVPFTSFVSVALLVYGSVGMLRHLKRSIADILGNPKKYEITNMIGLVILILLSGALSLLPVNTWWFLFLRFFLHVSIIGAVFLLSYHLFSSRKMQSLLVGAALAGVFFNILRLLFGIYLTYSLTTNIYGAGSSIVVLLLYTYFSAQIFFFGALWPNIKK